MPSLLCDLTLSSAHFGTGALDSTTPWPMADTLFSALCLEALNQSGEAGLNKLFQWAQEGALRISDGLPRVDSEIFLPKPVMFIADKSDASSAKEWKRVTHIPLGLFDDYLAGQSDPAALAAALSGQATAQDVSDNAAQESRIITTVREHAQVRTAPADGSAAERGNAEPFRVAVTSFKNVGLSLLVDGGDTVVKNVVELLHGLGESGIGGERSTGLGRFMLATRNVPASLESRLSRAATAAHVMTLSVCLPSEAELTDDLLTDSTRMLVKRSGWVWSPTYAETPQRKKDIHKFVAGSVFAHPFSGCLVDAGKGEPHPVWSYAKPLWIGV